MLRFISWNVNGLRACVGKDFENQFKELDADFFCLQETKMQEGQFSDQKEMVYTPQDYRFTVNHGNIYAIALKCPQDGNFCVQSLAESSDQNLPEFHGIIRQVEVLGYEKSPEWKTDAEGLHVKTSGFYSEFPVVLKIVVS